MYATQELQLQGSTDTLSPNVHSRHHSMPRMRANSAEPEAVPNVINPSHSLNESGSPKISLASRMKRQPTVDTYSFTKKEFEVLFLLIHQCRLHYFVRLSVGLHQSKSV